MNKTEAIKMLNRLLLYCDECPHGDCEKCVEAINMAEEALEQQTCDNCKFNEETDGMNCYECLKGMNDNFEALDQEPSEDCISRKRLRESLKKELVIVNNNEMYWQGWHDCTVAVETRITDAPSVVPKQGKWEHYLKEGLNWKCSGCGSRYTVPWSYCPNCGARMESDGE